MAATLRIPTLLRGDVGALRDWTMAWRPGHLVVCGLLIVVGAGSFGAAMGAWRAPLQALYCAAKLPLILILTALGNGVLNAMLAPLLGLNLPARQSMLAVLMSFTLAALILGSFSPLLGFLVWNLPPLTEAGTNVVAHSVILLVETAMIACAGILSNVRLAQLLGALAAGGGAGRNVLWAWLAVNLFLGSQLAWVARPFVGSPRLPVQFFRPDALEGSFFEALGRAAGHLFLP